MHKLQDSTGFIGFGETSWESGDVTDSSTRKTNLELIIKADTVPLLKIIRAYNIRISEFNKKITCPFKSHNGGREFTPSFMLYPHTNTYCCFGCRQGSKPTDFVANMENISKYKAALKIINLYGVGELADIEYEQENFSDKMKLYMEFSDYVYEFIQHNIDNASALKYIEKITWIFDKQNSKCKLSNDALESLIFKLKDQIDRYSCQQL